MKNKLFLLAAVVFGFAFFHGNQAIAQIGVIEIEEIILDPGEDELEGTYEDEDLEYNVTTVETHITIKWPQFRSGSGVIAGSHVDATGVHIYVSHKASAADPWFSTTIHFPPGTSVTIMHGLNEVLHESGD